MKKEQIKQVNFLLAAIASNYMECNQGDILYDQTTIINRLEELGEVELYVSRYHFDTEERFQEYPEVTNVEQARAEARQQHWGEWTILLEALSPDEIRATFTKSIETAKEFPFDRLYSWVALSDNVFSSKIKTI
jgi:hypothetical protein